MDINSTYKKMNEAAERLYKAGEEYFAEKSKLSKSLSEMVDTSVHGKTALRQQMDHIKNSPTGQYLRAERDRINGKKYHDLMQAAGDFRDAADALPELIDAAQPDFDVSDQRLKDSLTLIQVGDKRPRDAARNILNQYKGDRMTFNLLRAAMDKAGVPEKYVYDIRPHDGDRMRTEYNSLVNEILNQRNEMFFSRLAKLYNRMASDAADYGVKLDAFMTEDAIEKGDNAIARSAMGLADPDDDPLAAL